MDALQVGPLAIPWVRVQVALALLALVGVAELFARRVDRRLSSWGQGAVFVGLLGARLGFVLENASVYAKDPLAVLYVWQGGFDPWWGILAGGGYTLMALPKHLWRYALGAALAAALDFPAVALVSFAAARRSSRVYASPSQSVSGGSTSSRC